MEEGTNITPTPEPTGFNRIGDYLRHHWIILVCLLITCTRTFDIFYVTSPLPIIAVAGVLVCEGSWFFWTDHVKHGKRLAQQVVATIGTGVTWLTIGLTSVADVLWVASQRHVLGMFTMPQWADLAAIVAVVAIALIHVGLHFIYNWIDPVAMNVREREKMVRDSEHAQEKARLELEKAAREATTEMDRQVLKTQIEGFKSITPKAAQLMGTLQFNEKFFKMFGLHPGDISAKDLNALIKMLDKTSHGRLTSGNEEQTAALPATNTAEQIKGLDPLYIATNHREKREGSDVGEVGGGVDHRNFP